MAAGAPVFTTGMALAGARAPGAVRMQLSRWCSLGRVLQLRRGVYMLPEPYRKITPHPFFVANALKPASYVSLQSALAHYGMIPEAVPLVTSVTTGRPETLATPVGSFGYRHVQRSWFHDARHTDVGNGHYAFIASPEKALLDWLYLEPGTDTQTWIAELRLQRTAMLDAAQLAHLAQASGSKKLLRAVDLVLRLREHDNAAGAA